MELKLHKINLLNLEKPPSNCTNMELKLDRVVWWGCWKRASNCTNMELKHILPICS